MNLFDGKTLAEKIYAEVRELMEEKKLSLGIFVAGNDAATAKFIAEKERRGAELGVEVRIYKLDTGLSTKKMRERVGELVKQTRHDGYIVQLPLPENTNAQTILNAVPESKDVDVLNQKSLGAFLAGRSPILPPVVGAVKTLLESQNIRLENKRIAVVGAGKLVGRPVALWLLSQNLPFAVLTEDSLDTAEVLRGADVVISGVGKPGIIRDGMIKEGAAVIDCGSSTENGMVKGDVDVESLKDKSGWLAAVPGGVGPLTVAYIFKNLAVLAK